MIRLGRYFAASAMSPGGDPFDPNGDALARFLDKQAEAQRLTDLVLGKSPEPSPPRRDPVPVKGPQPGAFPLNTLYFETKPSLADLNAKHKGFLALVC